MNEISVRKGHRLAFLGSWQAFRRHLGDFVGGWRKIIGFLRGDRNSATAQNVHTRVLVASGAMSLVLFLAVVFYLRQVSVAGSPQGYLYLEVGGTLLSFCYAANALVRFRGTHDRTALILAFGFVLSGIIETAGCFGLNDSLTSGALALSGIPMGWMVSRTLLAVLLLAAIAVERYMPTARQPSKETAAALLVVALAAYMTSAAFLAAPAAPVAHAANLLSRPWDLLPAVLFLIAAVCFRQRLENDGDKKGAANLLDHSLFIVASLNVVLPRGGSIFPAAFRWPVFSGGVEQDVQAMSSCFPARCWSRLAFSSKCARWLSPTHSRGCPITAASSVFLKRSLTVSRRNAAPLQHRASRHGRPQDHQRSLRTSDRQPRAGAYRQDSP